MNISAKLKVSASKSTTSPSCKPLPASFLKMTAKEFVENFKLEKDSLLKEFTNIESQTEVQKLIQSMKLNEEQAEFLKEVLNSTLLDTFYTILLGLDGCSMIGESQQLYEIKDENGNLLSGEIEGYAYEYFHEME